MKKWNKALAVLLSAAALVLASAPAALAVQGGPETGDAALGPQPPDGSGYTLLYTPYKDWVWLTGCTGTLPADLVLPAGSWNQLRGEAPSFETFTGFAEQQQLRSVVIPEGVETILGKVFRDCTNLEEVSLPRSLTYVAYYPFEGCSKLKTIRHAGTEEEFAAIEFDTAPLPDDIQIICSGPGKPSEAAPVPDPAGPIQGLTVVSIGGQGDVIMGIPISSAQAPHTASELIASLKAAPDLTLSVRAADGSTLSDDAPLATGCQLIQVDASGSVVSEVHLVVSGDVLGTGTISIAQIVRITQALNGSRPLDGLFLQAGLLVSGSGQITIADVVRVAQMLNGQA